MFESAELGHTIDKKTFKAEVSLLREALLEAQFELREKGKIPVIILISGVDGAGKSETIHDLYEWLDPRYISTQAFSDPSDEESERPFMWRYWRALPPRGQMSIFAGSWYSLPIARRISGDIDQAMFDQRIDQFNRFEAMLVNEGALILKFWFHLSREGQKKRLKALEKDPRSAWRVTKESWERLKTYDQLQEVASHLLRMTNTPWAPWIVVEGTDDRYRSLTVGKMVLSSLQRRLADPREQHYPVAPPIMHPIDTLDVLTALDLTQTLPKPEYEIRLAKAQGRLSELVRSPEFKKHSLILAFEGADAAGKGGSIRRLVAALDARQYQIVPIAAPTEEERVQPYLWRFWRYIPRNGRTTIFDRTWYGRVLVERVEGFCSEADWLRAYAEINDFEHELVADGAVIVKFWLQISKEEQLRRFEERENISFKRYKITEEDWRNRDRWDDYHQAICDMVERTSTGAAPWTLVEANDKYFARVKVLETVCNRLEEALFDQPRQLPLPQPPSSPESGPGEPAADKAAESPEPPAKPKPARTRSRSTARKKK
ncbi:MAG: polyphosphate:AMP phosphotransferase [Zoogloeaceae bacterium]|jgi:polyphosphate:AMP phosphotransferase|nr:polyphosphate:AMP phosphotransferase [Zoogloeaceae bacterium]